jgi:hypothetical protein
MEQTTNNNAQVYSLEILLLPNMGQVIDLGSAPVEWKPKTDERGIGYLEFHDAPYNFYDYIDSVFGVDASDDNSADKRFADAFFTALHQAIESQGGLVDGYFTFTMPKEFFSLAFHINVKEEYFPYQDIGL